ncbi:hypothetical protein H9Q13_10260 [Pontibacter sp. JH31]|uniref:Muconolactone delta-isomerase n=1 Tax=Pontibacter aquaedesilientis TaxID=2766980 RepID=A0ABR7XGZ6_9BACT|nr:hypothetical protein [Pontibacter aquaedesilientis]MBD1397550.1 hypothetical protein [Pontibacter aquaedesilientis]
MLEFSLFEKLPERSQAETLATEGIRIAQRQYNGLTVTLYTLHGRFVELWAGNSMEVISTFQAYVKAFAVLEPYTADIDMSQMLEPEGPF